MCAQSLGIRLWGQGVRVHGIHGSGYRISGPVFRVSGERQATMSDTLHPIYKALRPRDRGFGGMFQYFSVVVWGS